jgi:hypothetical protein
MTELSILFVDDEDLIRKSFTRDLHEEHFAVTAVGSGSEAIDLLKKKRYDLVITDLMMPEIDGFDVLKTVKQYAPQTSVLILTGYGDMQSAIKALRLGANDFAIKPCEIEEVVFRIRRCLEKQSLLQMLSLKNLKLEEEIARRRKIEAELKDAQAELETANRELESFNRTVSHDLRSPVLGIANLCRIILEKHAHSLDEKCSKYFLAIHKETLRLDKLINTLLGFSRLSRQEMQMQEVDLSEMARTISQELQSTDPGRRAEFFIADHLSCRGDQDLLMVALNNLLGNAWKYSAKEALSKIEFGAVNGDDPAPTFYVRDNGAGFNRNYADKLFRLFQRLHTNDEFEGHGIGLVTVERIIQRHGGRVWGESEKGEGASFYFTLK